MQPVPSITTTLDGLLETTVGTTLSTRLAVTLATSPQQLPLYCLVQNSNTLKIWSNSDLTFTGQLVVTLSTSSVPSSTTFYFSLYDKYISSSDYGISVYTSTALSNNPTGYSILPVTNILWRRQAYKQLRTDAAPYRITVNNNFEYVSAYNMGATAEDTANSHGLVFSLPTTISGSTKFKCLSR